MKLESVQLTLAGLEECAYQCNPNHTALSSPCRIHIGRAQQKKRSLSKEGEAGVDASPEIRKQTTLHLTSSAVRRILVFRVVLAGETVAWDRQEKEKKPADVHRDPRDQELCDDLAFFFSEVVHPVQVTNLKAEVRPTSASCYIHYCHQTFLYRQTDTIPILKLGYWAQRVFPLTESFWRALDDPVSDSLSMRFTLSWISEQLFSLEDAPSSGVSGKVDAESDALSILVDAESDGFSILVNVEYDALSILVDAESGAVICSLLVSYARIGPAPRSLVPLAVITWYQYLQNRGKPPLKEAKSPRGPVSDAIDQVTGPKVARIPDSLLRPARSMISVDIGKQTVLRGEKKQGKAKGAWEAELRQNGSAKV
ncbi:hypothetical protein U0070_003702 [Myodes glareolus]|uniref:Uncharacterized protein n=1 Tax=Myodes glareolus TaxID=447135 RepID=A0AAW0II91_MYOGA